MRDALATPVVFALVFLALVLSFLLLQPKSAASQSSSTVIFLTSGTSWTVPSDWNSSGNTIEVIGGGGGGDVPASFSQSEAAGGGGGGYSKATNVSLTTGTTITYVIGSGGGESTNGGDTYFCRTTSNCSSIASSAVVVGAKGGTGAVGGSRGVGGQAANGIGGVKYSGGSGGDNSSQGAGLSGSGGGAAAGPNGNGGSGGNAPPYCSSMGCKGGTGGGGANAGANGSNHFDAYIGSSGGNNRAGTGGGAGGANGGNGGSGVNGGGGGGGFGNIFYNKPDASSGGNGSQDIIWTQTSNGAAAGPGGGGGGGGWAGHGSGQTSKPGGSGALYGGGGGGGSGADGSYHGPGAAGAGAQGIIVITYTPISPATVSDAPTSLNATGDIEQISLSWTAPASDGGSPITAYKIYRNTSSPAATLLDTITPATTYLDSSALTNTTYYYSLKATNAVGDSAFSNEVSATRPCSTTAPSSSNVRGWAWSDTIGWISLSSADQGTCTSEAYGLDINQDGTISGKIWSENIGWISADAADLSGCPTSPCTARMEGSAMEGWMKALAANQSEAAWDGFISLSGSNYGPTVTLDGTISGYMWGDTNIGWITFDTAFSSATTTWVACTPSYSCTDETHAQNSCTGEITACTSGNICTGGAIACIIPPAPTPDGAAGNFKAKPQLVAPGRTTNLTWNIRYATECRVEEDNPNITDTWSGVTGSTTTSPIRIQTVYTLTCTGPGTGAGGPLIQKATVYQTPTWKEL